jgi:hypothetical protein
LAWRCFFFFLARQPRFLPTHEPDSARRPVLAVNIRIPTLETLLAQINLVLHADIRGFTFWMASAFSHASFLLKG